MKKSLLLIGYNFAPESTGIGKYSGEMIRWLGDRGHGCTVITTYPYYPHWEVQAPYRKNRFWYTRELEHFESGGKIVVIRCPIYVPKSPTGLKRILLDFSFILSSFFALVGQLFRTRHYAVMAVAPSFLLGLPALLYKWVKRSKFYYHIQDLQIDAARDLGMIKWRGLLNFLFWMERVILRRADSVFTISPEMSFKIASKFGGNVSLIPNWSDGSKIFPLADKVACKTKFGFLPSQKVILYSGAIGQKQGLEAILEAAKNLGHLTDLLFVICGSGPYKAVLEEEATRQQILNLRFLPLQPLEEFNAFLNAADVHLVIQKEGAGDLMLPSKLTNILAVGGIAIVTANKGTGLRNLIDSHHLAYGVPPEDQEQLEHAIQTALSGSKEIEKIRSGAIKYNEAYLSQDLILGKFAASFL